MSDWAGRRVLVTGAGGFIGSHLAEALHLAGANVRAFVHYNALGSHGWLERSPHRHELEVFSGDISDPDSVRSATNGIDTIFHLAALIGIPYSYQAARSYVNVNILGTLNVLQAAKTENVRRVVHTSSSEVYGTALTVPIKETHPLRAQSPYSATKIAADKLAEAWHLSFGSPVVTIRPFNTFGPRQSARAVIPTIIAQCLKGEIIRLGSVRPTRDFNYVTNTVEGFLRAGLADAAIGRTIQIGSGREIAIGDTVDLIARIIGQEVVVQQDDQRLRPVASEVERLVADNTLARDLLGWEPRVDLETGLKHTIDWQRAELGDYRASEYAI